MKRLALLLPLALTACDQANMVSQPKSKTWDSSPFFPQGQTMRLPAPGTVPRAAPDRPVPQPASASPALLARGAGSATTCSARPATATA